MVAALGVLLLGVGALVLLANPRHRAFYFGEPSANDAPGGRAAASPPRLPAAPAVTAPPATPATVRGSRIPMPDAEGRIRIPLADQMPWRLPAEGAPLGWEVKEFEGQASVELVRDEGRLALKLRSDRASFALYRDVVLDVRQFPYLTWSWKVLRLPTGGDVREPGRDDQAAQIYLVFPRWPAPTTNSDVIGYVWDTRAPVGTQIQNPRAPKVRLIVVESGSSAVDTWQQQRRNVAEDYAALFGRPPPARVGKVAIMIDSNDTGGLAEALIGELVFSRASAQSVEIPTSMLR